MKIILASNSPRRKEILSNLGIPFGVVPFQGRETSRAKSGDQRAKELSDTKAVGVATQLQEQGVDLADTLIIAADTVVVHNLKILGKPRSRKDAFDMLQWLQGDTHFVITGVSLYYNHQTYSDTAMTKVCFAPMTDDEIEAYIQTGSPMDKAGSYGIQDMASCFIKGIVGDYFNVVGFPVHLFYTMLPKIGLTLEQLQGK